MKKIRILFLINSLGGGGAERVLVNLVNNMDQSVFDITVETMFSGGVNRDLLAPHVNYFCKNAFTIKGISHIYKFLSPKYLYRKFIGNEHYDIIVAYMHNLPIKVISGAGKDSAKLVGWCHCGTVRRETYCTCWTTKNKANNAYNKCDVLVGVSKQVVSELNKFFKIDSKTAVIYNTNDTKYIKRMAMKESELKIDKSYISICTVGRFAFEKGNDRLLDVAARLTEQGYAFNLYFIGDGAQKEKLAAKAKDMGLDNHCHFLGFQKNPYAIVQQCDLFVCPSREEGFSTAVTEAIILGKPVVSTDVSGAKEILGDNNEYGLVVENSVDGLYGGIKEFLDSPKLLENYEIRAQKRSALFNTGMTVQATEDLFVRLMGG